MSFNPAVRVDMFCVPGTNATLRIKVRGKRSEQAPSAEAAAERPTPAVRQIEHHPAEPVPSQGLTFRQAADAYIATHRNSWKSTKHAEQWGATLEKWVYPLFGDRPVADIDVPAVFQVIETPVGDEGTFWAARPETARRVLNRIEAVLDWAKVRGHRAAENPARWRGNLDKALPIKGRSKNHHAALPFAEVAAFLAELRTRDGISARALEFTVLTAARTGEVLGARWAEVDLDNKLWTIPAPRMKSGRPHRVPLNDRAVDLLRGVPTERELIFLNPKGKQLSNMALLSVLNRMGRDDITVHGFRSTFRDWAAETTNYQNEVLEMALAHVVVSSVEAAYRRGDLFEKRRRLMDEWGAFCCAPAAEPAPAI